MNKRWDSDARGEGVAWGAAFTPDIQRLITEMNASGWVAEEPEVHLLPRITHAIERSRSSWRLVSATTEPGGRYLVRLVWARRRVFWQRIRAEAFMLIGSIAEHST